MEKIIYTIGYAGFSKDSFIEELRKNEISVLVDVRSSPFSSFHSEYNKDVLEADLKNNGIHYRNYAREFGARQDDLKLYYAEGYLDFEKVAATEVFQNGVAKLCNSIDRGYVPALMCAEKEPIDCHRAILVSRAFHEKGCKVIHILPENKILTQDELNYALLEKYFPDRDQLSLFGNIDERELINEAYRKRNFEIGYRIGENV